MLFFFGALAALVFTFALHARPARADGGDPLSVNSFGSLADDLPTGLAEGSDGNVWLSLAVAGGGTVIAKIAPDGTMTEYSAGFDPNAFGVGVTAGPDGNVWFAEVGTRFPSIGKISPEGNVTLFSAPADTEAGLVAGGNGNLWFLDGPAIGEITPTGLISTFTTDPAGAPGSLTAGPDGTMWFTDAPNDAVGEVTPGGTITEYDLPVGHSPSGLVAGPAGDMWFADGGSTPAVGRVTPDGTITEYPVGADAPHQLVAGPYDTLWFASHGGAIERVTADGTITDFGDNSATELTPGPDGNMWFLGPQNGIGEITPSGAVTIQDLSGTGLSPGYGLEPIAGADGGLWLAGFIAPDIPAVVALDLGVPGASAHPPLVSGSGKQGDPQLCTGATWSTWAGEQPSLTAAEYDGYQWLLDGAPIAGATNQSYTPGPADSGHALACTVSATYPLFPTTVSATSTAVTIQPAAGGASGGGGGGGGGGAPNLHVAVSASPVPHEVGDQFDYELTVTNEGGASNGSTLTVNLPPQVAYEGFHVDRGPGCTASGQTVSCNLDFFPPGQSSTVQIGARVTAAGTATLTTSTFSSPGDYDPTNSAISFPLTIGSTGGPSSPPPPAGVTPTPPPALVELSGLKAILLHLKHPSLTFKVNASGGTALMIELLGKNGKLLASWRKTAGKGTTLFKLLLPPRARRAGKDKLELLRAGMKAPTSYAIMLKA